MFRSRQRKEKSFKDKRENAGMAICRTCIFSPSGETRLHLRRVAQIEVATSVCTGGSNMPLAYCDLIFRVSLQSNKKCYKPQKRFIAFWSEWRDSNSRHSAPKYLVELFSNIFRSFLAPFIPEKLLFETLVSVVSMYSKPSYGQICGQKPLP